MAAYCTLFSVGINRKEKTAISKRQMNTEKTNGINVLYVFMTKELSFIDISYGLQGNSGRISRIMNRINAMALRHMRDQFSVIEIISLFFSVRKTFFKCISIIRI